MFQAAPNPPALVVLSHLPKVLFNNIMSDYNYVEIITVSVLLSKGATKTIAWVGKGIMYDTGGLSIKGKVTKNEKF